MDHLKNLLAGAAGLFSSLAPRHYPANGGFAQDRRNLRGDFSKVSRELRSALKEDRARVKRGEQTNAR